MKDPALLYVEPPEDVSVPEPAADPVPQIPEGALADSPIASLREELAELAYAVGLTGRLLVRLAAPLRRSNLDPLPTDDQGLDSDGGPELGESVDPTDGLVDQDEGGGA